MSNSRMALAAVALMLLSIPLGAQTPDNAIEVHLTAGPTRSYGGDYEWYESAAYTFSMDARARTYRLADLRMGFSFFGQTQSSDILLMCTRGRTHECVDPFPAFRSAQFDVAVRRSVLGFALGVAARPGITWIEHSGGLPSIAGQAEVSRLLWGPIGVVAEGANVYLPWAHGERLGVRGLTFGLRLF